MYREEEAGRPGGESDGDRGKRRKRRSDVGREVD